jgi:hypothetical protein
MISSEVPTAGAIGIRSTITSAGTTRHPPPTPRKPVRNPTAVPQTTTFEVVAIS